jgi:uncharacterized protein (TIGR02996 family)
MDEVTFLRCIREDPDNEHIRLRYLEWLEEVGDMRASYFRLIIERQCVHERLSEIDWQLEAAEPPIHNDWLDAVFPLCIRCPTVGRCYTIPSPGAQPFIAIGDYVTPDTVVGLIESMLLFNEITAGVHGVVSEILVENRATVEYRQILYKLTRPPRAIAGG